MMEFSAPAFRFLCGGERSARSCASSPKPERNAESETKAKTKRLEKVKGQRARPNAADEPPRTWRVPYTVGGESNLPWFVTPL